MYKVVLGKATTALGLNQELRPIFCKEDRTKMQHIYDTLHFGITSITFKKNYGRETKVKNVHLFLSLGYIRSSETFIFCLTSFSYTRSYTYMTQTRIDSCLVAETFENDF